MRVLVTGAAGFVGRGFLARLAADSRWSVRACSRTQVPAAGAIEWVRGPSLDGSADWTGPLERVDAVVHLAAKVHVMSGGTDQAFQQINVEGTRRLAQACADRGVRRFIFLSSVKVHGERGHKTEDSDFSPVDPYGRSKRDAERALAEVAARSRLEIVNIRSVLVYGPGAKGNVRALLGAVRRGIPLPFAAIDNRRSLVGLDNLVDLIVRCLDHPAAAGEAFLVSDGEDLSTPALIRRLAAAAHVRPRLLPCPVAGLKFLARITGRAAEVQRLTESLTVDISKAKRLLGWVPPHTVNAQLGRLAEEP